MSLDCLQTKLALQILLLKYLSTIDINFTARFIGRLSNKSISSSLKGICHELIQIALKYVTLESTQDKMTHNTLRNYTKNTKRHANDTIRESTKNKIRYDTLNNDKKRCLAIRCDATRFNTVRSDTINYNRLRKKRMRHDKMSYDKTR